MTSITGGSRPRDDSHSTVSTRRAPIRKIAVDLTPVLPGGDNGGAKLFAITLINQLARRHPRVTFVLLTNPSSHAELAHLDRANVIRHITGGVVSQNSRGRLMRLGSRLIQMVPRRVRPLLFRVTLGLLSLTKARLGSGFLRKSGVDLLFCPFTAPTFAERGIPVVSTLYDLQYATYPEFFTPADVAHRDRTFRSAARRASFLVSISEYSRRAAIDYGRLNSQKVRTVLLRMAKRADFDERAGATLLARLGLEPGRYIIFPANFWRHKNHSVLLMAFRMAMERGLPADIRLVCTGSPGERGESVKESAVGLGLGDRVVFTGFVRDDELMALVAQARAMVFPSLFEGFGLPVLEAMALGVPVACSNVTSLPEVAGEAALLFDPRKPAEVAKAIVSVVNDDALREELSVAGRLRAHEFADEGRMADEYWKCFSDAVGSPSHATHVYGVDADGWAGRKIEIDIADAREGDTLVIELRVPPATPHEAVSVQATRTGEPAAPTIVERGQTHLLTETLAEGANNRTLQFSPTFHPGGGDQRELALIVERCWWARDNQPIERLIGD